MTTTMTTSTATGMITTTITTAILTHENYDQNYDYLDLREQRLFQNLTTTTITSDQLASWATQYMNSRSQSIVHGINRVNRLTIGTHRPRHQSRGLPHHRHLYLLLWSPTLKGYRFERVRRDAHKPGRCRTKGMQHRRPIPSALTNKQRVRASQIFIRNYDEI